MGSKKADPATLEAVKAVMKKMLETPPSPHEAKGNGKAKKKAKRRSARSG
jgi:hypothetical protein